MTEIGQLWRCNICGNIIEIVHDGADSLVCCNQPMELLDAKTEDPELGEKHVPVIEGKKVKVGSVEHPMIAEHYIQWIEATDKNENSKRVFLKPGDKPEVEFCFEIARARAYCNLHGLWGNK
jgi:superoxide reductase